MDSNHTLHGRIELAVHNIHRKLESRGHLTFMGLLEAESLIRAEVTKLVLDSMYPAPVEPINLN